MDGAREWDGATYHRVSIPQQEWGLAVLERVDVPAGSIALDAGCGTGRLTEKLLARLGRGRVIAVDSSRSMLVTARTHLAAEAAQRRVTFLRCDLAQPAIAAQSVDLVFSTATLHWITDHESLFAEFHRILRPGGRLIAQCGGAKNIEAVHGFAADAMRDPRLAPHFVDWRQPWFFGGEQDTAERLRAAGFIEVRTRVHPAPTVLGGAAAYREFISTVILRAHLAVLPDVALRDLMLDLVVARGATTDPPWLLDYWRLDIDATAAPAA